jgi:hypothetical protein
MVKKDYNFSITDSPPLSVIQQKKTTVKDSIGNIKERKLNLEDKNQGTVSIEKKHRN